MTMGIRGVKGLIEPDSDADRHWFVDYPAGSNLAGKSCVRCGRVKANPIHFDYEEKEESEDAG